MKYLLFSFLFNCAHLFQSDISSFKKVSIFIKYAFYFIGFPAFSLLGVNRVSISGVTLEGFDFVTIYILLAENFVRNQYYFKSARLSPVIFDCGASIGDSVLYFKYLYPHSKIYAFEPDPATYALLRKNIRANNLRNVLVGNIAISAGRDSQPLYFGETTGGLRMSLVKSRIAGESIRVKTQSILQLTRKVKTIDLLKLDVEGSEMVIVSQLVSSGEISKVKELIVEYHHHIGEADDKLGKFLTLFEKAGFKYQIDTSCVPLYSKDKFQDILILGYRG